MVKDNHPHSFSKEIGMWGLLRRWVTPEETVLVVEPSDTKVDQVAVANERLNAVRARVDEVIERSMS